MKFFLGEKPLHASYQFKISFPNRINLCLPQRCNQQQRKQNTSLLLRRRNFKCSDCCLISFSDPSTHIEGIGLGWYVGNEKWLNFQRDLVHLIEALTQKVSKKTCHIWQFNGGTYLLI